MQLSNSSNARVQKTLTWLVLTGTAWLGLLIVVPLFTGIPQETAIMAAAYVMLASFACCIAVTMLVALDLVHIVLLGGMAEATEAPLTSEIASRHAARLCTFGLWKTAEAFSAPYGFLVRYLLLTAIRLRP